MILSAKKLVRLALCYIILMASSSKCEIDSSSSVITTTSSPEKVPPAGGDIAGENAFSSTSLNRAFSIPSSEETVKTSSSYSSSSSSFTDVATSVTFNNTSEQRPEQQRQASGSYTTSIISKTINPNAVSPILTLSVPHASQQEVEDSGSREEVEHEKQGQPQHQNGFVIVQNRDNNSNKKGQADGRGETLSSSSGASQTFNYNNNANAKYYEKMSSGEIGSISRERKANSRAETKPETITELSIESFAIMPQLLPSSLPRRQTVSFPRFVANKDRFFSSSLAKEYSESPSGSVERDSSIPMHTWIPAGLSFSCKNRVPGYYADASSISKCQVYHMCMTDGRKYTLLCGIGTVFNQLTFVCDHWYNYQCTDAESDYKINRKRWEDFIGDDDDEQEKLEEDSDQNDGVIENDAVHQSVPLRSPFTQLQARSAKLKKL